ncbi:MAG: ubiquinone/menaquinone biosynthesis C-methylase UbiE [Paraglaciecola sp.]|jgi:ubiquinone/menaquinone biosynthesis C-methylase UbiE
MSTNALYTDLSDYYDVMCADINYQQQSSLVRRLDQIFGNKGEMHLDLACGTGPHVRHFIDFGYTCSGLDINQPMLALAKQRCPQAHFSLQNMCEFKVEKPLDLITCFLYSIHYSEDMNKLTQCIVSVHKALQPGGVFCFNAVDKNKIDNSIVVRHTAGHDNSDFVFNSAWHYCGHGEKQSLRLSIEKTTLEAVQSWQDEHPMVAFDFDELMGRLTPYFDVHVFEHDFNKIVPWDKRSGNGIFVCVKI